MTINNIKKFKIHLLFCLVNILVGQSINLNNDIKQKLGSVGISTEDARQILNSNMPQSISGIIDSSLISEPLQSKEKIKQEVKDGMDADISQNSLRPIKRNQQIETSNVEFLNESTIELIKNKNSDDIIKRIKESEIKEEELDRIKKYFGYNIFKGNPELFQSSTFEPIGPDYVIGPGDEVIMMLWGETEINKSYTITRDGYVFIPNLGQVFVNGLTLEKLEKKLFKLLKKAYSSLDPANGLPTTFFSVSLGSVTLKPIRVFVLGEVEQPGAYSLKPSATLFSSLFYFNGPKTTGSLREIKLIRNKKEFAKIDYYDYLTTGKMKGDVRLQRDDVIFIPPRKNTVSLSGRINNPKIYEFSDGEDLLDVIEFAGGLKSSTFLKRAQVKRILSPDARIGSDGSRTSIDVNLREILSSKKKFKLVDGDMVYFFDIDNITRDVVEIKGSAIKRPGSYQLTKGMQVLDLIINADSLKGDAFLERAEIIRWNDDRTESIILIDLRKAINDDPKHNIYLKSRDVLTIQENSDVFFKSDVSIKGHVKSPGNKPFYKGMTVYDLLILGGGFEDEAHSQNTFYDRADLTYYDAQGKEVKITPFRLDSALVGKGIANTSLEMGCEITIYTYQEIYGMPPNTVNISGHVKKPGAYEIVKDFKILDLLFLAGGFDDDIHLRNTYMERFDVYRFKDDFLSKDLLSYDLSAVLKGDDRINFPIEPGDEVIIYSKDNFITEKTVTIRGSIITPGIYELKNKMTLKDLIIEANGVSIEFEKFRADISRPNYSLSKNKHEHYVDILKFSIDNNENLFVKNIDGSKANILLNNNDIVTIRPESSTFIQKDIVIDGLVRYPGTYTISNNREKISDIIDRAGGLTDGAYPKASEFYREGNKIRLSFDKIIKNPRSRMNFIVQEGDIIDIKGKTNIVQIVGEVNNPGYYQYLKGARFNDYIELAGGYTKNAYRYGSFVQYPDGSAKKYKLISRSPKVLDGAIINVLAKEETEKFNMTEYISNLTEIYADLSQAYLLVLLTLRNN